MADPIEDLAQRWKRNPDAASTIALCDALRANPRANLVQQVGEFAMVRHASDPAVLVAVARMYLEGQRLSDAQATLVAAGKAAPREGTIYRWLGEVLLRRGDAERAEKVLERAIQLGTTDAESRLWLDRARVFKPVQAKAGPRAVAAEVSQAVPAPPGRPPIDDVGDDSETHVRVVPERKDDEGTTEVIAAKVPSRRPPPSFYPPDPRVHEDPTKVNPALAATQAASSMAPSLYSKNVETVPVPTPMAVLRSAVDQAVRTANADGVSDFAMTLKDPPAKPASIPVPTPPPPRADFGPDILPSVVVDESGPPKPKDVLRALALAGIFEPPGSVPAAMMWDKPSFRIKRRGAFTLSFFMVAAVAGGVGTYRYVQQRRDREHSQADAILGKLEADIRASRASSLPDMEQAIGHAFELDSRSPRAALDWMRERALVGLVKSGSDVAFEDAISRAKEVGVPEADFAFARIASFLFQGDTAGAAALLPKLETPSGKDPWYQLLAGATLEHAGDPHAFDRYESAVKLDPQLIIAQILQAKDVAIDGDPQKAADLAKQFKAHYPERAEGPALICLAWARDPERGDQPPADAAEMAAHAADLPLTLQSVPHALAAMQAVDKHALSDAKAEVDKALAAADGPGVASWLGTIALDTGDE